MKRRKIDGYVECSALTDTESVKKVFEKACKLGLSQIDGIKFDEDAVEETKKTEEGCCSICWHSLMYQSMFAIHKLLSFNDIKVFIVIFDCYT